MSLISASSDMQASQLALPELV